nr:YihY/virulence factor BrkB family protein [candidate division KSB1 bacterium]NIV69539.1 YihY family inner membrane protein [Phycisphaerae bacterium]NIS24447.1 YihY/virulence factor BrkB family protein [candidate division KSB1 bacterium]NIU25067.1 YihY/virulence factor BrkB family protein [candidate division KSB1 bacterium]NIU91216.1 YihY family inner membrane protein [candidate division KSB1 bacterium]
SLERQIGAMISKMIPYSDSAAFVKRVISSKIEEVVAYKELAGYLGAVGLLFAASGLFSTMRTILNRVYNIHSTTSMVLGKLKDIGMVLLVVILIPLFITVLPFFETVLDLAGRFALLKFLRFGGFQKLVLAVGSLLSIFTLFGLVYYLIPNKRIGLRTAAISALSASVLWEIAKQGFGFYIKHFASLGRIYGAYLLLVVVAFWIYYSSLVFIIGAEIGQLYRERSTA